MGLILPKLSTSNGEAIHLANGELFATLVIA